MSEKEPPTAKPAPENYFPSPLDGEKHSHVERLRFLEAKVAFLLDETSELRRLLRLTLEDNNKFQDEVQNCQDSFDYQWRNLPEGKAMLSNQEWKATIHQTIAQFTRLPPEWFKGKILCDAACGNGRWTYGFGKLQAGGCLSFDISENACQKTREISALYGNSFRVIQKDLREPLNVGEQFDLVWCFGALHHTGAPHKSLMNLTPLVKPGGYIFLMLYGEPRPNEPGDYLYYCDIFDTRCRVRHFSLSERVQWLEKIYGKEHLHGYFDAVSPEINDRFRWDEIVGWLKRDGFTDITRTLPNHPNHHVIARKA